MANDFRMIFSDISISTPQIDARGTTGAMRYIKFGDRNDFPQVCAELVADSPTQQSITDALYKRMKGASVNVPENTQSPNPFDTWADLIEKCLKDYSIYEAFALQIVLSMDGSTYLFYHQPVADVRLGKSEYGANDIPNAYINTNWRDSRVAKTKELKMWATETPQMGTPYLMYCKEYNPTELYYHIPNWFAAANWVKTDARIAKYYNNFVANNFNGNKHIDFPMIPTQEEKRILEENIKKSLCGEGNGGEVLITYSEGEQRTQVSALSTPDADLYNNVSLLTKLNIVTANELPSPVIAGIATGSGFSSKAEEILAAETAYRLNVVQPKRQFVLRVINKVLHLNGNGDKVITIEDYNLMEEYKGLTTRNDIAEDNGVKNNVTKETEVSNGNGVN